jgi:aminoglycoside N3'-acetyltransferase
MAEIVNLSGEDNPKVAHQAVSDILYVRARLSPFSQQLRKSGDIRKFLGRYFGFQEILVPYFRSERYFWQRPVVNQATTSGSLGRLVSQLDGAMASSHPSHRFSGLGPRVSDVLRQHDENTACFYPIGELARRHDISMLLLGCGSESPGFSTVHVVQNELGLTRKHLLRYFLRWDFEKDGRIKSVAPSESPGCSMSFDKFYPAYEQDNNLIRGTLMGTEYLFVPSARRAMEVERAILSKTPRFVECGRPTCLTCRFRLY